MKMTVQKQTKSPKKFIRAAKSLAITAVLETAITFAHFAHNAFINNDQARLHVVEPALIAIGAAAEATIFIASSPGKLTDFLPVSMADPFLAMFSRFAGACIRLLKVILVFTGAPNGQQKLFWTIAPVSAGK